jgi:alkylated DNA repair protein alkB family protein 1
MKGNKVRFVELKKKYKRYRNIQTNFNDVIDFRNLSCITPNNREAIFPYKSETKYRTFCLKNPDGFRFLEGALSIEEQLYLAEDCLTKWPASESDVPVPSNLDVVHGHIDIVKVFDTAYQIDCTCSHEEVSHSKKLLTSLRWITLGYHYNWTKRIYQLENQSPFPQRLSDLVIRLAHSVGYRIKPEAAIVNFYQFDSSLCGHCDDVEFDFESPIVSISIGNSAVFLLGGRTSDEEPKAMFVRSGDVVIMGGQSRLCMHGVPRIIEHSLPPDFMTLEKTLPLSPRQKAIIDYLQTTRININVRQVFKENRLFSSESNTSTSLVIN